MTPATKIAGQCSKCQGPLDGAAGQNWCKACRAKYQREYEATRKQMTESHGFQAGVTAMRQYLVQRFSQYGTAGSFSGQEIAATIAQCKGPNG